MTIIERSIVIPVPAAVVWATLTDTGRYGSWNPFIPEFTGGSGPARRSGCASVRPAEGRCPSRRR